MLLIMLIKFTEILQNNSFTKNLINLVKLNIDSNYSQSEEEIIRTNLRITNLVI